MTATIAQSATQSRPAGTARLTVDIPHSLHRHLRIRTAHEDTTMTEIIVRMLEEELREDLVVRQEAAKA